MFSLKYKINGRENSTTLLVKDEVYANEYLDLVAQKYIIDEVSLTYLQNYKPSNRKVFATTRSFEQEVKMSDYLDYLDDIYQELVDEFGHEIESDCIHK